jgi:hypothetical protein
VRNLQSAICSDQFSIQNPNLKSNGEQMLSTTLPQIPSLHPSWTFLRSLKKSIFLIQSVACARFSKNPPTFRYRAQKVISERLFPSRKTWFLRAPDQWTPHILRNHSGEKLAAQKKLTDTNRGDSDPASRHYPRI